MWAKPWALTPTNKSLNIHPLEGLIRVNYCGGGQGLGSHRGWCAASVGRSASFLGGLSQQADHLPDTVGSNDTAAANAPYLAASNLRTRAEGFANVGES